MTTLLQNNAEHLTHLLSIAGRWTFDEGNARYEGPHHDNGVHPFGIALSNQHVRDAIVRSTIKFRTDTLDEGNAAILLGYDGDQSRYTIVGLGGHQRAYSISEFNPAVGWRGLRTLGQVGDLQPNRKYAVEVVLRGQRIVLNVDGIRVFEHTLPHPLTGNQVGLYAYGHTPVEFSEVSVERTRARLFVAMQFSEPFNTLYKEVVRPVAEQLDFDVVRIDEISGPGIIFQEIQREIADAKVIVAEVSSRDRSNGDERIQNPNVMYELGYAHALDKPTVLLAQRGVTLPFDIRSYRVVFYDNSIGGKPDVERNLERHLRAILDE